MKAFCEFAGCCRQAGDPSSREEQPVRSVQTQGHLVFRQLVEKLQSRVFRVAYALLGDLQEADEAAQKVFVTMYRKPRRLGQERGYVTWAYELAVAQCLKALWIRRLRQVFIWLPGHTSTPTATLTSSGRNQRVPFLRALSAVPDKERALLVLREVGEQSVEDIATIMHMDSPTVRRRLFDARKKLMAGLSLDETAHS